MDVCRAGLDARPRCGKPQARISTYGVLVTCPACLALEDDAPMDRVLDAIHRAAQSYTTKTATP